MISEIDYEALAGETSGEAADDTEKSGFRPAFEYSDAPSIYIIPCIQDGAAVRLATENDGKTILDKISALSEGIILGEDGLLTKAE